ncbi:BnaAnng14960D [Brassica napus]|nr:BnaAnng14960D [Brassica napus]
MDMRRCKRKNMEIGRRDSYYIVVSYSFLMRGLGGTLALR